ncbi:type 2 periplasmic-binding domain-containing protein [Methylotetracoccus oryzae]|uniref:TAXI family TRAP transporter solute-binding subunit n=1 Tax=Methylotetracoccus oryzae TaxID=1919059 RepID=UPI0013A5ABA3|nr:TAXI family TRAP transporter solute-binding subunit [Methylotetracoccus oryzae]
MLRERYPLFIYLALFTAAFATVVVRSTGDVPAPRITLTAGLAGTTRAELAQALADDISSRGTLTRVVPSADTTAALKAVNSGAVDLAMVSGIFRSGDYQHVLEVTPLYAEALHLLVKREMAEEVTRSLTALRGHIVSLGSEGSETHELASNVLGLLGISSASLLNSNGIRSQSLRPAEIDRFLTQGRRNDLPDAVFHLATVPSKVALKFIRHADYRLVPIPFSEAFRLSSIVSDNPLDDTNSQIERLFTQDVVIPPFTYEIEPPVPAGPMHTLGAPLLLVANESVSPATIERVMEAVFDSRFARFQQPPLDRSLLALPSRMTLHPGSASFREREHPLLTADDVDTLSNSLSVLGALLGAALFLREACRQRGHSRRHGLFTSYLARIATIERRLATLELSSSLDTEKLSSLQRELLELKGEALEQFSSGVIPSQSTLVDLLGPINNARDHIARLLLCVREAAQSDSTAVPRQKADSGNANAHNGE